MPSVPEVREQVVEKPRNGFDVFPCPAVELRRLEDLLPDLLPAPLLVEDLVGAMKDRAVHVPLLEELVDIEDRVGPLRLPIDFLQDLEIGLQRIPGEEFVKEPPRRRARSSVRCRGFRCSRLIVLQTSASW